MSNDATKKCNKCEETKSLTEFYTHPNTRDGYLKQCKLCQNAQTKLHKHHSKEKTVDLGENLAVVKLRSLGIYAASGKSSEWKKLDIVAWGCVRVEVKTSVLYDDGTYRFNFTSQSRTGLRADLIMLICLKDNEEHTYHLFPASHSVFFRNGKGKASKYGKDNRKSNVLFDPFNHNPKNTFGLTLTPATMNEHRDRWELIEHTRMLIHNQLLDGTYDAGDFLHKDETPKQMRLIA